MTFDNPNDALRYHVTGAIERGDAEAIIGIPMRYHASASWNGGYQVTAFNGPDPMYVLARFETMEEAQSFADDCNPK